MNSSSRSRCIQWLFLILIWGLMFSKNPKSTLVLSKLAALYAGPLRQPARGLEIAKQAWTISQSGDLAAALGPIGYVAGDFKWAYGVLLEADRAQPNNGVVAQYAGLSAYAVARFPQAEDALTRGRGSINARLAPCASGSGTAGRRTTRCAFRPAG